MARVVSKSHRGTKKSLKSFSISQSESKTKAKGKSGITINIKALVARLSKPAGLTFESAAQALIPNIAENRKSKFYIPANICHARRTKLPPQFYMTDNIQPEVDAEGRPFYRDYANQEMDENGERKSKFPIMYVKKYFEHVPDVADDLDVETSFESIRGAKILRNAE